MFEFKNMKRSKILEEIIKTVGLTPVINVKGLNDDVTDFTTKSSEKSDTSSTSGDADVDALVEKIVGDETDSLKKCEKIHLN